MRFVQTGNFCPLALRGSAALLNGWFTTTPAHNGRGIYLQIMIPLAIFNDKKYCQDQRGKFRCHDGSPNTVQL